MVIVMAVLRLKKGKLRKGFWLNRISIALLGLLYFISAFSVYASDRSPESKNELSIFFKSTTFEIDRKSFDDVYIKLDPDKNYLLQGYSCSNNEKSKEDLLTEAEKRAEIVKNLLQKKGFPSNNLTTIAYDHHSECKVILIAIE